MIKTKTINDILAYIEDNIDKKLQINLIVDFSGFSRRYIQLVFKKYIGVPLGEYIRRRKIARAAVLLRLTNTPIIDIAFQLHFDSQQTFTREFKKITGCSPYQYRKEKDWDLKPLLISPISSPQPPGISFIKDSFIYGSKIVFNTTIPYKNDSEYRRRQIMLELNLHNSDIWCMTTFFREHNFRFLMRIETVIGTSRKELFETAYYLKGGCFAHFSFSGNFDGYFLYMKEIYTSILPFYGLKRRGESQDIEVFSAVDNVLNCEIFIPV